MKVIKSTVGQTNDGISLNLNFDNILNNKPIILYVGIPYSGRQIASEEGYKILLNYWSPCEWGSAHNEFLGHPVTQTHYFNKVLNICKYSTEFYNKYHNIPHHTYVCHPVPLGYIPQETTKQYDVCYFGGNHGPIHQAFISEMVKHGSYKFLTQDPYQIQATDINVPYKTKLDIIAQCKITICFHGIPISNNTNIIKYLNAYTDKPLQLDDPDHLPQFKARVHEAAICKSVILLYKDKWNLMKDWYPDGSYVEVSTIEELQEKIKEISNNFDNYKDMIELAYQTALKYGEQYIVNEAIKAYDSK